MNQQLKQRIIGAIVLISLAVIFIPALLDGSHKNISPLQERQTPQKPNFYFEDIKLPPSVDAGKPPSRIIESSKDISAPKPNPKAIAKTNQDALTQVGKLESKIERRVVTESKARSSSTPAPSAWVVQIASLLNSKRALGLKARLKKEGFPSFVEEIPKDGKTFYRVRVGPELKQDEAEALRKSIKKKMQLDGTVMRYQPL